jgi:tetratricopeptide (TPR) repeat protein
MASDAYRVCPNCDTRNKIQWEFCVKCGESLVDVPVGAPASAGPPVAEDVVEGSSAGLLSVLGMVVLIAGSVVYLARTTQRPAPPRPPADSILTLPTVPPGPPTAVVASGAPGAQNFERGRVLLAQRKPVEALKYLADAVAEDSTQSLYHDYYAKALWETGATVEAMREFDAAVSLAPSSPDALADRARVLVALDRRDDAVRDYTRLLELEPNHAEALQALGKIKNDQGNTGDAIALLRRAAQQHPDDAALAQDLGYALEKSGSLEEAGQKYAAVLARVPEAQITRGRLAEVLLQGGKPDQAVEVLKAGLQRTPDAPLLHRSLGSVLERSGRVMEAVAEYREYARLAPKAEDASTLQERADGLERRETATREARKE